MLAAEVLRLAFRVWIDSAPLVPNMPSPLQSRWCSET